MFTRLFTLLLITMVLTTGCMTKVKEDQKVNPIEPNEHTYIVLKKDIMSSKYILEVSNTDEHKYIEVSKQYWDQINKDNSVTFNDKEELIKINNKSIQ